MRALGGSGSGVGSTLSTGVEVHVRLPLQGGVSHSAPSRFEAPLFLGILPQEGTLGNSFPLPVGWSVS